ncbi:hypothetical protein P879_11947 [Paragonimus westermani]|uniref:Reverse transcriptase domain-containing protein n=1 Tax=Paragonimus westermani TaxID=34504 RepID=A0A8T0DAN6_9TREM|nr:hypothetical protein P879_11947 [Paragonimus westermani]
MAFLDISKSFDSVSHETILRCARKYGLPPPLVRYLTRLYKDSLTIWDDAKVCCGRGVRQGDPLSPSLFIMVMDEVLSYALPEVGFMVNGRRTGELAYADDLVLFANSQTEMVDKLEGLDRGLEPTGMKLNNSKCRTATIVKDGKRKHLVLLPREYETENGVIPSLEVDDKVKYLGLQFNWKGCLPVKSTVKAEEMLESLTRAPLKPHQRLEVLKSFLIPKLKFELVLGNAHRNTLRKLDRLIRNRLRGWLRLPKDTTLAFLHTKIDGHGLGISCLETVIPLEQRAKFERLMNSGTPVVACTVQSKAVMTDIAAANVPIRVYRKLVSSKLEEEEAWKEALVKTHDGADLLNAEVDRASFHWLRNPQYVFPRLFIRGLQLRGGLLNTKVRSSRGNRRAPDDMRCRGLCGCPESVGHIMQKCALTHDTRCARHNRVVQRVGKLLSARGHTVFTEPIIPSGSTFCKPDLVVGCGSSILVMDVTIVNTRRMIESWNLKIVKYHKPAINEMIPKVCEYKGLEARAVKHIPIVLSDRGMLLQRSGMALRRAGLTNRDLSDICLLTTVGSLKCYDTYMRMT